MKWLMFDVDDGGADDLNVCLCGFFFCVFVYFLQGSLWLVS